MSQVQVIKVGDKPAFYVVPADVWERVRGLVEDAEDAEDFAAAVAADDGVRFPAPVANAILGGASLVQAWREHRGMTIRALAGEAGVSKPYMSQIEAGKRTGTAATLKKIAAALGVPVGALVL